METKATRERRLLVYFRDDEGNVVTIPAAWTDHVDEDPVVVVGAGRSWFRVQDLLRLSDLIERLQG